MNDGLTVGWAKPTGWVSMETAESQGLRDRYLKGREKEKKNNRKVGNQRRRERKGGDEKKREKAFRDGGD